jgi:hypothetical protein
MRSRPPGPTSRRPLGEHLEVLTPREVLQALLAVDEIGAAGRQVDHAGIAHHVHGMEATLCVNERRGIGVHVGPVRPEVVPRADDDLHPNSLPGKAYGTLPQS